MIYITGKVFTCISSQQDEYGNDNCVDTTGEEVLDLYNMNNEDLSFYLYILTIVTFIYFLVAFLVFRIRCFYLSH